MPRFLDCWAMETCHSAHSASVGADVRQYLASHMPICEQHPKLAPYKTCTRCPLHARASQQAHHQSEPILLPLLGGERALHMHAKHRCRCRQLIIIHALGPCEQEWRTSQAKPHLSFRQPSFRMPNLSYRNRAAVRQTTSVLAVGVASLGSQRAKVNGNSFCATSSAKIRGHLWQSLYCRRMMMLQVLPWLPHLVVLFFDCDVGCPPSA